MSAIRGYVELMRPANVATALADVLAGFAVSGLTNRGALPWLLASTACLYAGGVVLNDWFDRDVDARERPERPIPSGRVAPAAAARLGLVLLVAGILLAAMATRGAGVLAGVTAGAILLYDGWTKRHAVAGPINMGLCRALNLLLGVAATPSRLADAWPLAFLPWSYITGVTALSRGEVHGGRRGIAAFALISLGLVVLALLAIALQVQGLALAVGTGLTIVLAWRVLPPFWRAYRTPGPDPIRLAIKAGVLSLVFLDAVIGTAYGGALYGGLILVTAFVAGSLSRIFPVT
jgi:4-hydroxybenzoate polyprenyltransferase